MPRHMGARGALPLLLLLLIAGPAAAARPVEDVIADALGQARAQARPALFVFVRGEEMAAAAQRALQDPRVRSLVEARIGGAPVRIDVAKRPDLADRWEVSVTPAFVLVDPSGEERAHTAGILSPAEIEGFLSKAVPAATVAAAPAGAPEPPPPPRLAPAATAAPAASSPAGEAVSVLLLGRPGDRVEVRGAADGARRIETLYRLRPAEDAILTAVLVGDDADADVDLEAHLDSYRPGARPAARSDRGGSLREEIRLAVAAGRTYLLRAYPYGPRDASGFRLEASLAPLEEGWFPPPAEAEALPVGREVAGAVDEDAPERWYRLEAEGPGSVVVSLEADRPATDLDLEVYGADGRLLALSDGEGGSEEAVADAARGLFLVRVFGFEGTEVAGFRVRAAVDADRVPPRLLPAEIPEATLGEEIRGEITDVTREAYRRVYVEGAGTLVVELEGPPTGADLDLEAFTEDGALLGRSDDLGATERLELDATERYWFVLRVYGFGAVDSGPYRLRTSLREGPPSPAGGAVDSDLAARSTPIPLGEEVRGRAGPGAEAWYHAYVEGVGVIDVTLDGDDDAADLDLEVYDGRRNLLGSSDGETSDERIEGIDASSEYDFYVRVFPYADAGASDFSLRVDFRGGGAGGGESPPADAPVLGPDEEVRGSIEPQGTIWRRVTAPDDGLVGLYLRGEAGDLDLFAVRADGTDAGRAAGTSAVEALLVPVRAGETFFVKVLAYGVEGPTPFVLWWSFLGDRSP